MIMDSAFKFLNSIPSFYLYYERKYNNCQVTKVNFIKKITSQICKVYTKPLGQSSIRMSVYLSIIRENLATLRSL